MIYDKQLVGKKVLVSIAMIDAKGKFRKAKQQSIRPISKVTRKGFQIEGSRLWFDFDGFQKQKQAKMIEGTTTYCVLLTDDEVLKIEAKWKERKRVKSLRKAVLQDIEDVIKSMESWT